MTELLISIKPRVNTSFDLDSSNAKTLSTIEKQNSESSSKSELAMTKEQKRLFLHMPLEIRHQIYDLLLVNRWRERDLSTGIYTYHKSVPLDRFRTRSTMEPAILQTCKQVCHEAAPVLYSRNVFNFADPDFMLDLIHVCGETNRKLIQSLEMDVYPVTRQEVNLWLGLFRFLPEDTPNLKRVVVHWWAASIYNYGLLSLGKHIPFAQGLAGLARMDLDKLTLEGCYAKLWPAYFRDCFGPGVVEAFEDRSPPPEGDDERSKQKYYDFIDNQEMLRKFQAETGLLNLWEKDDQ
ncbi:hypothetical protein FBEOM_7630 [Fusarium beomiforme]|uniref:Uncharacterized protein n=1 Tax=Fusarium beomiforme TaxID=44412 RepID=A0A9P5DWW6_9HYPO|nr:hypothetical protein FBEOM_7630 [Fusarium beomiforme]